jgi:hypothetical protein
MPRVRNQQELLAGQLVLAIQKIWNAQAGEPEAEESEQVMHASHNLLQAAKQGTLPKLLLGKHVVSYLGEEWFQRNSSALQAANELQESTGRAGSEA